MWLACSRLLPCILTGRERRLAALRGGRVAAATNDGHWEQLSESKGVICPPAGVDPGISLPPVGGCHRASPGQWEITMTLENRNVPAQTVSRPAWPHIAPC
jgi:hypothetical protein